MCKGSGTTVTENFYYWVHHNLTGVPEPFPELGSSKSVVGERQAKRQQTVSIEEKTGGKAGIANSCVAEKTSWRENNFYQYCNRPLSQQPCCLTKET